MTITGTATQGQTLTAANTLVDADGLGAITYQWKANGTAIIGANGLSYTLTQAEVGKAITVTATYTDVQGTVEQMMSSVTPQVANVNDAPTGSVSITGTATQGQTLTAANTLADADGMGSITYQWNANGTAISGANGLSYTLTQAEVGKAITVTASYTDEQGTAESKTSSTTSPVANINDEPTGSVTITGTATQGQTLTASNTLVDLDGIPATGAGAIHYHWFADGSLIEGATGDSHTLTEAEVGKSVSVEAVYTDLQGSHESVMSASTPSVIASGIALSGLVYHWKSHALLSGVDVQLSPLAAHDPADPLPLFELRNVTLNAASGDVQADVWVNLKAAVSNLDLQIDFDPRMSASFVSNSAALPAGWMVDNWTAAGTFSLAAMGLETANGSCNLGQLILDLPTGTTLAQLQLSSGRAGDAPTNTQDLQPHVVTAGYLADTTVADGAYVFDGISLAQYGLRASKAVTNAERAITSIDALAALKIAVGRNPNADPDGLGPQQASVVSPYQFIAADVNKDGSVSSVDALAILKMAVNRPDALADEWLFVSESEDFWDETANNGQGAFTTTRSSVKWDSGEQQIDLLHASEVNLVAVLKGDVNGDWAAPADSQYMTDAYFGQLEVIGVGPVTQWGLSAL